MSFKFRKNSQLLYNTVVIETVFQEADFFHPVKIFYLNFFLFVSTRLKADRINKKIGPKCLLDMEISFSW